MAGKKKTIAPANLQEAKSFEDFATVVKQQIGEASDEVLQAWFEERNAKPEKSGKKPAESQPAQQN